MFKYRRECICLSMDSDQLNPPIYPWQTQRRFNAYSDYFKRVFGCRVQKLSINAGFTCPNRDGHISYGGCSFCDNAAFNPSYCKVEKSIYQQIEEGILFHRNRYRRAKYYLAYFQAYSNTYAPLSQLKDIYNQALAHPNIVGLVIGTRPDCIDDEKLDYFSTLAKQKYVIIGKCMVLVNMETHVLLLMGQRN